MTRLLTAVPIPADPAILGLDPLPDPESRLWLLVDELWEMGERYKPLAEELDRLKTQLADPALTQAYPVEAKNATLRRDRWEDDLHAIETEARLVRHWLGDCWLRLPARRRNDLLSEPSWPGATTPAKIAGELWERAKAGRETPAGRCPF